MDAGLGIIIGTAIADNDGQLEYESFKSMRKKALARRLAKKADKRSRRKK